MNGRTNTTSVTEVVEGVQVALEAPTNLVLTPLNARVDLTWTDPVDKYAAPDGQTATNPWDNVATWDHTIVVRKAGSAPTSPDDGELIYTETTRNQHQYTAYSDTSNVINNTVYYYAVYAVTSGNVISEPVVNHCKPIEGTPVYIKDITISQDASVSNHTAVGDYAIYKLNTGRENSYYSNLLTIDKSLTQNMNVPDSLARYDGSFTAKNQLYGFFAGGDDYHDKMHHPSDGVFAINASLTTTTAPVGLKRARTSAGGASGFGQYVIFAGGYYADYTGAVGGDPVNDTDAFDQSLTRLEIVNHKPVGYPGVASVNDYAIVAGGGNYAGSRFNASTAVSAYDSSMTKNESVAQLAKARDDIDAISFDNRAVFFGGKLSFSGHTGGTFSERSQDVDVYDNSLTRTSGPQLPVAESIPYALMHLGSYIVMALASGMGESDMYMYDYSLTNVLTLQNTERRYRNDGETVDKYGLIWGSYPDAFEVYEAQ